MKKRYIVKGFVEYFLKFHTSKGLATCRFERGAVSGLGCVPASFITDNEEVQKLLEAHADFKSGRIKLATVYGEPKIAEEKAVEAAEVTTLQGAREYLMGRGATMEELQTKAKVLECAVRMNVVFPNWK